MSMEDSILFMEVHWTVVVLEFGVVVHTNTVADMKPELSRKAKGCSTIRAECPSNQWFH